MIIKNFFNNVKQTFMHMFNYQYETTIKINADVWNYLLSQINTNISSNNIINLQYKYKKIILNTTTNVLKTLHKILPTKYLNIEYTDRSNQFINQHEYIIDISNISGVEEIIMQNNINNLSKKYNADIQINGDKLTILSDQIIKPNVKLNIRFIQHNGPESLPYYTGLLPEEMMKEELNNLMELYKERVSYPVINSNSINTLIIKDNLLILQLDELAFFQATEMFKKYKYDTLVIEIDGKIHRRCMIYEIIRQQITLSFKTVEEARDMHQKLLYNGNKFEIINQKTVVADIMYKLFLLILLLCILIFFAIKQKKYIKHIIIASIFILLSYTFKISYLTLANLIILLILDNFIQNIYINMSYVLFNTILLFVYQLSYMYNGVLIGNFLYSIIILLLNIVKY